MCKLKNRHWSAFVVNKKQDEGWMCCSRWVTKGDAYHYLMINTQAWFHTTCELTFSFLLFFFFPECPHQKKDDRICSLFAWNDPYLCLPDKDLLWLYKLWQMLLRSQSRSSVQRCYSSPRRIWGGRRRGGRVTGQFDTGDRCSHSGAVFVKPNRTKIM